MEGISMPKLLPRIVAALVLSMATSAVANRAAAAEPNHYEIVVQGMACPFCTYGLERKLEDIDGVGDVDIDLEAGRATFDVHQGKVVTPAQIERAVDKAGFTLGHIEARLRGTVRSKGGKLVLVLRGGHELRLRGGPAIAELRRLVKSGPRVRVVAGRAKKRGSRWTLSVQETREPRPHGS